MTPAVWVALGLWVAAVAVQTLTTLLSGRLKRLEQEQRASRAACEAGIALLRQDIEAMRQKASDEGDRQQRFVNEVEIRLDRMEQRFTGMPGFSGGPGPRPRR